MNIRIDNRHIHTPDDGRGTRDVFVNGKPVECVIFADTKRGLVRAALQPLRLHKHRKRILTYTLHGEVVVKPKIEPC